jgi:N-acetylmuramic acid 6-phosphate (MurNAc-6-P) etherase
MKTVAVAATLVALALSSCTRGVSDLVLVTKSMKKDVNAAMTGAPELGMGVPASGSIYWVEGTMRNDGREEAKMVSIAFRVTDGNSTMVLTAVLPSVPPGKTVGFRTPPQGSRLALTLIDEEPVVTAGR